MGCSCDYQELEDGVCRTFFLFFCLSVNFQGTEVIRAGNDNILTV